MFSIDLFLAWLQLPATWIAVFGPALLFMAGLMLVRAWRGPMTWWLVAVALLCVPFTTAYSYWGDLGYHVFPAMAFPFAMMVLLDGVDMRKHWFAMGFATWLGLLIPDALGAFEKTQEQGVAFMWFWGVGGAGALDGLVLMPLYVVAAFWLVQEAMRRGWLNPAHWHTRKKAPRERA